MAEKFDSVPFNHIHELRMLARASTMSRDFHPRDTFWLDHIEGREDAVERATAKRPDSVIAWIDLFAQRIVTSEYLAAIQPGKYDRIRYEQRTNESRSKIFFVEGDSLILTGPTNEYTAMKLLRSDEQPQPYLELWTAHYFGGDQMQPGRFSTEPRPFECKTAQALRQLSGTLAINAVTPVA